MATQWGPPASPISIAAAARVVDIRPGVSDDARESRAISIGLQIAVEHHRDRAHEVPAGVRDLDAGLVDKQETHLLELAQLLDFGSEVLAEIQQPGKLDRFEQDLALAHQRHDHRTP